MVFTDDRLRPIKLGNQTITFKQAAPSRLYWAGRPAMRVVQALYWVKDLLPSDRDGIMSRLNRILNDPGNGLALRDDLKDGLPAMPTWMQSLVRELLHVPSSADWDTSSTTNRALTLARAKAPKRNHRPAACTAERIGIKNSATKA
jgi:hypothetical protein